MIKHKWISMIAAVLMVASALAMGFAWINPSALAAFTGTAAPQYVSAMEKTEVLEIQIIAEEDQWSDMLENATAEEYIPVTVVINGDKIENVGIRPKGNSSLTMVAQDDSTDRYSFKLEFDHYITGQTWMGLDKLVINNMQGDASYMKEYLSYDIMDYIGVETPRYAFADISVNGETWGFYLAVESLEDSYAQRVYGADHGQLYKPESMGMGGGGQPFDRSQFDGQMPDGQMPNGQMPEGQIPDGQMPERQQNSGQAGENQAPEQADGQKGPGGFGGGKGGMGGMASNGVSLQYTDDEISSYSSIFDNAVFKTKESDQTRLIQSLKKLSLGEDLEDVTDVEAVLRYFAAHTVVVNLDSYSSNMGHNYYLYEKDGQLTILPWDYNLAFGGFQSGSASSIVNFPIDTPVSGVSLSDRPLLSKLLEVPEYLELYHSYLRQIVDGYFNSGLFEQTVDSLETLIDPYVKQDPTAFYSYEAHKDAVPVLKELGLLRAQSIDGQLDGTVPATSEDQKSDPDKLVDASALNLSALGSQGGGGGPGGGGPGGRDRPDNAGDPVNGRPGNAGDPDNAVGPKNP